MFKLNDIVIPFVLIALFFSGCASPLKKIPVKSPVVQILQPITNKIDIVNPPVKTTVSVPVSTNSIPKEILVTVFVPSSSNTLDLAGNVISKPVLSARSLLIYYSIASTIVILAYLIFHKNRKVF